MKAFSRGHLLAYAASERRRFERSLREMVEIPSVSVDSARARDVTRVARFAAELIRSMGGRARIVATGGHPLVHGLFHRGAAFPTVTLYNHLDVQPAARADGWRTEPFRFTPAGDRYFGRGTTDDKGPALTALWGAAYALRHGAKVNFQILWETEEEIGSPHFEPTIRAERHAFATDAIVVSDTVWVSRARPACSTALRGLQGFRLTLETGATDQHSGTTGGPARNPVAELCALIAECVDAGTGRVKIPGFYDDVVPPSRSELAELKRSGFTTATFKRDHLLRSLRVDDPVDVMKRLWCLPTFEVHGIAGGYQGPGLKTIVPPRATAIISCRLVPNMTTSRVAGLVKAWVRAKNPDVEVETEHGLAPYRGHTTGPHPEAIRAALRFAFRTEPVLVREGGSIGAVLSMERVLRAPVFFLGLSLPEHGYHAPNENYDWRQARGGMLAFADYLRRAGEIGSTTAGQGRGATAAEEPLGGAPDDAHPAHPIRGRATDHGEARHREGAAVAAGAPAPPSGGHRPARPASRRVGAPGPAPVGFARGTAPLPRRNEDLCYLAGDWRIFQRLDGHRWSLDDLVTAWVAAETLTSRCPARLLDLGCGIGSVLLLLAWRFPGARCTGIEAQRRSVDLARRSVAWNGVEDRCGVIYGDFRIPRILHRAGAGFDLVTATPPYLAPGTATPSHRPQCRPCRLEDRGGIETYCQAAARTMAPTGRFVTCMAWPQDARTRNAARRAGLAVERTLGIIPRAGKAPLFAVYVMTKVPPRQSPRQVSFTHLVVRDAQGRRTDAFRQLRQQMGMPP